MPLRRGAMIRSASNKSCWVYFQYERLPTLCYTYDCCGYSMKDSEMDSDGEEENDHCLVYGEWLRASPFQKTLRVDSRGLEGVWWKIFEESSSVKIYCPCCS